MPRSSPRAESIFEDYFLLASRASASWNAGRPRSSAACSDCREGRRRPRGHRDQRPRWCAEALGGRRRAADRVLEPEGSILQPALELFGAPRGGEGRFAGDAAGAHELDEGSFEGDHALVLAELNLCGELMSLALADLGGDRVARAENLDRRHAFAGLLRRYKPLRHDGAQDRGELDAHLCLLRVREDVDDAVDGHGAGAAVEG